MAEKLGEALLDLDTNDKGFRRGIAEARKVALGLGADFDNVARRATTIGGVLVATAVAAGAAFASGLVAATKRLEEARKAAGQVDQALKNSGNSARTSSAEIAAWADKLEERTGRAAEDVMGIAANLASYGFDNATFYRSIDLANDMAAAWGGDLKQNMEGLARALDDPINGMAMLSKRGIKLTDDQKKLAESFVKAGQDAKAQGVVFDALEAQVKGVAEAGFGGLSKALALAQKRWEDAFEDLVTGKGQAADLRDSLISLVDTLSSKETIDYAMRFGAMLVEGFENVANAILWARQKAVEFVAWLDSHNPETMMTSRFEGEIARLQELQRLAASDTSGDWFMGMFGASSDQRVKGYQAQIDALKAELARRAPVNTEGVNLNQTFDQLDTPTFTDPQSMWNHLQLKGMKPTGDGGGDAAGQQSDALKRVLEDLRNEAAMVGLNAQQQAILNAQRRAGVTAASEQGKEIENLIKGTDLATQALERQQQAYELIGDIGKTAMEGLVKAMDDGKVEATELLGILGDVLSMVGQLIMKDALSALSGQGGAGSGVASILGGLFSGFHADGGLIPNGTFGIVGERGPEPVIGTPRGAMVMPNSTLAGMGGNVNNITINGSKLSQSELEQAVHSAIDRFSRNQLPGRVAQINRDPLGRG